VSTEHLSFDELAELAEGLLARRRAAAVRAHLAACAECAERAAMLERSTATLRGLRPVTMPEDVAARLDLALANADAAGGETVVPDLGSVRRRRLSSLSWPYAAAAAVVAVAAVGIGFAVTGNHHDKGSAAASNATSALAPLVSTAAPSTPLVQAETGRTYTPDTLRALAPELLGPTADVTGRTSGGLARGPAGGAPLVPGAEPSVNSGSGSAKSAPPRAALPGTTEQFATHNPVPTALERYANSRRALLHCAAYITDTPGAQPLAVDYARWSDPKNHLHKVPSLILVFADPDDAQLLDVYVVAPACDSASLRTFTEIEKGG
jgi:anti-sigma factor RsiW